jgi:hypothetical protein
MFFLADRRPDAGSSSGLVHPRPTLEVGPQPDVLRPGESKRQGLPHPDRAGQTDRRSEE